MEITKNSIADCLEFLINKDLRAIFKSDRRRVALTIKDVAYYLRISERTAARLVYNGDIKSKKVGGSRRIMIYDFVNYLSKL